MSNAIASTPSESIPHIETAHPRILVVEDDVELELPVRRALRQVDPWTEVDWFTDGSRAYWQLVRNRYDLVVADIWLEGSTSGVQLWRLCRVAKPDLPFLLMSALWPEARMFTGHHGPLFLSKPFSLEGFRQSVRHALVGGAGDAAPPASGS